MFEESPVTEHAANGHVEGAIKRIAGQVRCIKDATEHKYKTQFHARHMILSWMIQHAAFLLNGTAWARMEGHHSSLRVGSRTEG